MARIGAITLAVNQDQESVARAAQNFKAMISLARDLIGSELRPFAELIAPSRSAWSFYMLGQLER